jgi:hypothetical protein
MSDTDVSGTGNAGTRSPNDTEEHAAAAHREYLAEAQQLVDQQFEALAAMVSAAATHAAGGRHADVTRSNHTLTVTSGDRSVVFTVEAVTDLPEGADRARDFPTGQARCIVQTPDSATTEWVLHRVGAGEDIRYTWVHSVSQEPIGEQDVAALLQSLFA